MKKLYEKNELTFAICVPAKHIRNMSITEAINAL